MCFDKESGNYAHKVAEDDIVCYKVMIRLPEEKPRWISLYQNFIYGQGELYEKKFSDGLLCSLDRQPWLKGCVYHSYSDLRGVEVNEISWLYAQQAVLVKCIIPKGAIYWANVHKQQYASSAIKIVGEEPFCKD